VNLSRYLTGVNCGKNTLLKIQSSCGSWDHCPEGLSLGTRRKSHWSCRDSLDQETPHDIEKMTERAPTILKTETGSPCKLPSCYKDLVVEMIQCDAAGLGTTGPARLQCPPFGRWPSGLDLPNRRAQLR